METVLSPEEQAGAPAVVEPAPAGLAAQPVDFRHPVFLSSGEWRRLRMEVEEFVESAGALLSTYLRLDFGLQLGKLHTIAFGEFTESLPGSTHLVLFKQDPLRGIAVMEIRPSIGLAIVDRLLGGPGSPTSLERNLSEMEVALSDQFVQLLLTEWCKQWSKLQELRPEILGHEHNSKFLQSSSSDTLMLVVTLEARMGESVGQIQLAMAYNSFEPLVSKLTMPGSASAAPASAPAPVSTKWSQTIEKIPLRLTARWPAIRLPGRALLALGVGSVINLEADDAERLELRIGTTTKFRGRLGNRQDKRAVQITEVCK